MLGGVSAQAYPSVTGGVPPGVILRIRFDLDCDAFLTSLTTQIVSNVHVFQSHERYGNSAFHVKLVELASNMLSPPNNAAYMALTCQQTFQRVVEVCARFNRIEGKVVPECIVNPATGEVCLHIKSTDCVMIGRQLSNALPGSNDWNCRLEENLLVSIGTFRGSHKSEFQDWLNNELSSNTDLFPSFHASSIEFSEEWLAGGYPQQAVLLTGHRPFIGSFSHFEGQGVVGEQHHQHQHLQHQQQIHYYTHVGHPVDHDQGGLEHDGLEHEHGHGGQLMGDGEHGEEEQDGGGHLHGHGGGHVHVHGHGHDVDTAPRLVWGMQVGGGVPAALRDGGQGGRGGKPVPRPAVGPYTKTSTSQSKQQQHMQQQQQYNNNNNNSDGKGGDPMVAWVCPMCKVENFPRRNACFKCNAYKPEHQGLVHFHPRKPIITPSKPDGDVRDGDWICGACNGHNFASKLACFTCRANRPPDAAPAALPAAASSSSSSSSSSSVAAGAAEGPDSEAKTTATATTTTAAAAPPARPSPSSNVKPGDWTCPKCRENVFAHRNRCYKCTTLKPSFAALAGADKL